MKKVIIREPKMTDVKSAMEMMNSLVKERAYIAVQKKVTLKGEKEYFKTMFKDKKEKKRVDLFLVFDGKVCGRATVSLIDNTIRKHVGEFGILIREEARGKGLGEKLLKEIIKKAVKELKVKIVRLNVFSENKVAINLYKKVGFRKIGTIKNGVDYYGKLIDSDEMIKYL